MDEQLKNLPVKSSTVKMSLWLLLILVLGFSVYAGVRVYRYRSDLKPLADYNAYLDKFKGDTYGGKTPEETLKLFVAALKKGDIDLASKYFALDKNASREKWVKYLEDVKSKNLLAVMARDIETEAKPLGSSLPGNFKYVLYNADGTVGITITLATFDNIWKIERL